MKLAVAMAGAATGFGVFINRPHLLFRAGEPEQRAEVFDGLHGGEIRAGCFIDRGHHEGRLGPRANEADRTGARVGFYTNVSRLEVGDLFAGVCWGGSVGAEKQQACHQSHEQSRHLVTRP